MEDKQIYAYSWRQDLVKKIKNYFKKEKTEKKSAETPKSEPEISKPVKPATVNASAETKADSKEVKRPKKEKSQKKEKTKEPKIIKGEKKEKLLTNIISVLIVLVISFGLLLQNNVFHLNLPQKEPISETNQITPTLTSTENEEPKVTLAPTSQVVPTAGNTDTSGCKVGGCNGEICADEKLGNVSSICLYQEKYVCYKNAVCERQADGNCGWRQTEDLDSCLSKYTN